MSSTPASDRRDSRNARVALACLVVFAVMTGAAFAAVPLYRIFCQTTGFAGAVPRANRAPGRVLARKLTVGFDTNVRDLPWTFKPEVTSQTLNIGATGLAFFTVTNNSDKPLTGRAAYNVAPDQAGYYFRKLQCFCFSDQTIPAHTTMRFPVVYFVDPKFASDPDTKDFTNVTLSYTFFPAPEPATKTAQALGVAAGGRL
jgi:cytochrome c oxidase assembly protein subunit 11